ncbi:MAG: patatin-like phospholipase family protein [Pseudomonadota bacterium]
MMARQTTPPTIGLALSGGAARGFAHIGILAAFERAGVRPDRIAGTSMGAFVGAVYAAGIPTRIVREHVYETFAGPTSAMGRLFDPGKGGRKLLKWSFQNWAPFDALAVVERFCPQPFPRDFADLDVPLAITAVDYYSGEVVVFEDGPLLEAIACSIAFPVGFQPVSWRDRIYIDGGAGNPLPIDEAARDVDLLVASDVVLLPEGAPPAVPGPLEALNGATQILMQAVAAEKALRHPPSLHLKPKVNDYSIFDFLKVHEIVAAGDIEGRRLEPWFDEVGARRTVKVNAAPGRTP